MRCGPLLFVTLVFVSTAAFAQAPAPPSMPPSLFSFVIPWDDASKGSAVDVSYLNAAPAGSNGFIAAKNGHFAESKTGQRIQFFGVNLTGTALYPEHSDAYKMAAHLAKLGVNIVRCHFEDANWIGVWDRSVPGHARLSAAALDKLDYFIAQLEKNGIYVDLNLHVARQYTPDDGFPDSVKQIWEFDKGIDNIDPHMIELQKQFATDYLTHVNAYTSRSYTDDPGVAFIELNNENSLADMPWIGSNYLDQLPPYFHDEVVRAWNDYLARKYKTTAALVKAWTAGLASTGSGSTELLGAGRKWQVEDREGDFKMTPKNDGTSTSMPDVDVTNPAQAPEIWHKQIHVMDLNLVEGGLYALSLRIKADKQRDIPVSVMIEQPDWHDVGLSTKIKAGTDWQSFRYLFQATRTVPGHCRLSFQFGADACQVSLADVKLTALGDAPQDDLLGPGASLEAKNIALASRLTTGQSDDWRRFLVDTETAYATQMRDFLRNQLNVRVGIVDTQMDFGNPGSLLRERGSDFADSHAYWQHPSFPGKPWDPVNWRITNTPMSDSLAKGEGGDLWRLISGRVAGRPFTVTEYNHPAPSDYESEMFPEYVSLGAMQDWDAIFSYTYLDFSAELPRDKIRGFFTEQGDPAKESFFPAAAMLFRKGLIEPLPVRYTLHVPAQAVYSGSSTYYLWQDANGKKLPDIFAGQYVETVDPKASDPTVTSANVSPEGSWARATSPATGSQYVSCGADAATASGYLGGTTLHIGPIMIACPQFGNNFAGLMLVSLDGKPLGQSRHLLLTITGKAENTDMIWNDTRTSVGRNWGHGPVQAEGIPATLTIQNSAIKHAWALDPTGARAKEVPVTSSGGSAQLTVGPDYQTVWYEIGG